MDFLKKEPVARERDQSDPLPKEQRSGHCGFMIRLRPLFRVKFRK